MSHYFRHFITSISIVLYITLINASNDEEWNFPPGFLMGSATSSYQTEGAWNISDKGESIWDYYAHNKSERINNGENGDVACDSYHKYKEDIKIVKDMGFDYYRFSISWPRILPTGYANVISKDGVKYYHDILDELERNNITPFVTIYHWDHPQIFQDMGGWTNEAMVDLFGDFARVVYKEFGHRVKLFSTINEPNIVCEHGYTTGYHAPGLKIGEAAEYLCAHNILKAHARAYHIYNDEFRHQYSGKVGIVVQCYHYYSKYRNDTDSEEVAFQFHCGRYVNPIFSENGDYPKLMRDRVSENSKYEGLQRSKLPTFSEEWIKYIRGSSDYLGFNHYGSLLVEPIPRINGTIYVQDHGLEKSYDPNWPTTCAEQNRVVPQGFTDILRKLKDEYNNPLVYVMENGIADIDTLDDYKRIEFLHSYIKAMLTAVNEYGCNVQSYSVWSLLDNFEWQKGYSEKYGLVRVDFKHPNRTRTWRKSAHWFSSVIRTRKLQPVPKHDFYMPHLVSQV